MRKDIIIEVASDYYGLERWDALDTYKDQRMTLQFINNLLTGIDSITSSSTLSVKLPRTTRNEKLFDFATRPQYESVMTHRKIKCQVTINGIHMIKAAYCYLLDSESDSYDVVIVFGLLQTCKEWIDQNKTLQDLQDYYQSINWNWQAAFYDIYVPAGSSHVVEDNPPIWYGDDNCINTYVPQNGIGKLMYYGIYNPGFDRNDGTVDYANVHPFVTIREIYERIKLENNLNFIMPTQVLLDMENLAVILTKVSGNPPQGNPNSDNNSGVTGSHPSTMRPSGSPSALGFGWNVRCTPILGNCWVNGTPLTKGKIIYKGSGNMRLIVSLTLKDESSFTYNGGTATASEILNAAGHLDYFDLILNNTFLTNDDQQRITPTLTSQGYLHWGGVLDIYCQGASEGEVVAELYIDNNGRMTSYLEGSFDNYWMGGRGDWDDLFSWKICGLQIIYFTGNRIYPNEFRCFKNLPDITQFDFIKFICQLYCLFPVVNSDDETIQFVRIEEIEENIQKAKDWSAKLLEYSRDTPKKLSFRIGEYARKNVVQWIEDEKDFVMDRTRKDYLYVDDETLDKVKDLVTLPFAASYGDIISQWRVESTRDPLDPYKAEFTEVKPRIMRVIEWYNQSNKKVTRLDFSDLAATSVVRNYYSTYKGIISKPRILTEHIRLNETDMRDIDFRIPVYLGKYGRFFAVKQIQWTVGDDYAEVELLQLGV
jgi:hypothetical protein